jgi:hypothetical protein
VGESHNVANLAECKAFNINLSLNNVFPNRDGELVGREFLDWV